MVDDSYKITAQIDGKKVTVRLDEEDGGELSVGIDGVTQNIDLSEITTVHDLDIKPWQEDEGLIESGGSQIVSPIPGVVSQVLTTVGAEVSEGQPLVVIVAMKMENELCAPRDGTVAEILVAAGQTVKSEQMVICLEEDEE